MTTSTSTPTAIPNTSNEQLPNLPVHRESFGAISCAVWKNQTDDGEPFYAATVTRTYRDPDSGDWRDSTAFGPRDLLAISLVTTRAAHHIDALIRADRRASRAADAEHEEAPSSESATPNGKTNGRASATAKSRSR